MSKKKNKNNNQGNQQVNFGDIFKAVLLSTQIDPVNLSSELGDFIKEAETVHRALPPEDQLTKDRVESLIEQCVVNDYFAHLTINDPKAYAKCAIEQAVKKAKGQAKNQNQQQQQQVIVPPPQFKEIPVEDENGNIIKLKRIPITPVASTAQFTPSNDPQDLYDMIVEYTDLRYGSGKKKNGGRPLPFSFGKILNKKSDDRMKNLWSQIKITYMYNQNCEYLQGFLDIVMNDKSFKGLNLAFRRTFKMSLKSVLEDVYDILEDISNDERTDLVIDLLEEHVSQNKYLIKLCKSLFNLDIDVLINAIVIVCQNKNKRNKEQLVKKCYDYLQKNTSMYDDNYIKERLYNGEADYKNKISFSGDLFSAVLTDFSIQGDTKEEKMIGELKLYLDCLMDDYIVDDNNYNNNSSVRIDECGYSFTHSNGQTISAGNIFM